MLNFSRFVIFICLIILLPIILNIVDNAVKIFNMLVYRNSMYNKIIQFSEKEFLDFVIEFFSRRYRYEFTFKGEDVYLKDGLNDVWLYFENESCDILNADDACKILGLCESRGINDVFIFTTRNLSKDTINFFEKINDEYNIRYIHKKDLDVSYKEFVYKFYGS